MVTCSREELVQKLQVRVVAVRGLAVPAGDVVPVEIHTHLVVVVVGRREVVVAVLSS